MAQKNKGFVSGKARYTTIWEKAPVINGKEEWFLQSVYNVEHLDQDGVQDLRRRDPVVAVQVSQAASKEQQFVRCETSSSDFK